MELRPHYPITTARLRMRPVTADDVGALLAYRSSPDVCRFLPFEPMDEQVLRHRLASDMGRREITEAGQSLTLGVELAFTGQMVGDVVLFFHSAQDAGGELGYVFHSEVAGHGYATEACAAMLTLAFDHLGLHRVIARMDARNTASARLASRLGMRLEAHHESSVMFKGAWCDNLVYALLEHAWRSQRGDQVRRRLGTPGHTDEHLALLLADDSRPVGLFSGG